jgi:hypothetical protein
MLHWLPESEDNLICLKATGKVTDTEYRMILPQINEVLARSTCLRILGDFSDFEGWAWAHALDKFTFAMEDVERIAIFGNERAKKIADLGATKLKDSQVCYFENKEAALIWVKE